MITVKVALYAVTIPGIPTDQKHLKEELRRCVDCGAVLHYIRKKSKESSYPPKEEDGD